MTVEKFVDVDGIRTRYLEAGDGPDLVLLHGGDFRSASSSDDWSLNLPGLGTRFRTIAPDKLGQGFTDAPSTDADLTMPATIRHFSRFLDATGVNDAVLVGHSRGALPVVAEALANPGRCRAIVIFDSNTLAPDHPATPKDFYPRAYANRPDPPDEEFVRRELVMNSYSDTHVDAALVERRLAITALDKTARMVDKMKTLYQSVFIPSHVAERERALAGIADGRLTVPVLIIWGGNDPSAPPPLAWDLFDLIAAVTHTEMHIVNRAGHYPYREHPEACNGVMFEFLDRMLQPT
jgi:2-hydroxy-6-oxonona-2,4-dienedioate hydrolase